MQQRRLGTSSLEVSAIGLGCMSMTGGYSDKPDRQEMISLIRTAVDRGVSVFDTAEIYGPYANDPVMIARGIFRDELRDVLIVLKNCGALRTREERKWCLAELSQLLDELGPADLT